MLALVPLGAASVTFAAGVNSTLQLAAEPAMRGRVMALYSVVFLGSTPIGGPIAGWLSEAAGPRAGLVLAGVAALRGRARRRDRLRRGEPAIPASRAARARLAGAAWRRGGRLRRGARSRYRPGVRISCTGSKAEEGST